MDLKTGKFQFVFSSLLCNILPVVVVVVVVVVHSIHVETAYFSFQNTFFYKFRMMNPSSLLDLFLRK